MQPPTYQCTSCPSGCQHHSGLCLHSQAWLLLSAPSFLRLELLDAAVKAREDATSFDSSRLVEFSERLVWEGPVTQLSPLVREPGRMAVTDQRVYFKPLHNISGTAAAERPSSYPGIRPKRFV
eukprot:GHUV01041464.1.p1 GENE.GHUV01041464.1~~GHUV01041464.1.p1  ORF type:complete len:123 (-),score=30.14 GHUV01041464.1:246-614(-)